MTKHGKQVEHEEADDGARTDGANCLKVFSEENCKYVLLWISETCPESLDPQCVFKSALILACPNDVAPLQSTSYNEKK